MVEPQELTVIEECHGERWSAYNADCVEFAKQMPDESIGFSIYSPPFANLFVYSDSLNDMGNCVNHEEFMSQYRFIVDHIARLTKPGRLSAVHCIDIPNFKWKHGEVSLYDFPGAIIQAHLQAGFLFHSRITIWKCPVVEMTRTKSIGLLYKQLKKDSNMSRVGLPDYLLIFRKPGDNEEPITHNPEAFPVEQWQKWASPVWMDINQTNTLNIQGARDNKDEKHICPLQLDLIERALILWSNPGDVVLSPFMGIGSEGVMSIRAGRKFVGVELKASYYKQACGFLKQEESQLTLI